MFTIKMILTTLAVVGLVVVFSAALKPEPKLFSRKPLTNHEHMLYHLLRSALPDYEILAQVPFSRFLITKGKGDDEKDINRRFRFVRHKNADFLICEKNFAIVASVELDDLTHDPVRAEKRDRLFSEAGITTIRWNIKALPTVHEIQEKIKDLKKSAA
jgi:hypothetical protein